MITVQPVKSEAEVILDLNDFMIAHAVTPNQYHDIIKKFPSKNISWLLFNELNINGNVEDGIFKLERITRVGFDRLYEAYLCSKFHILLKSVTSTEPETGIIHTPVRISDITEIRNEIIQRCNEFWKKENRSTPEGVGDIIYDIFSRYDEGVGQALRMRLNLEYYNAQRKANPTWVENFISNFIKR